LDFALSRNVLDFVIVYVHELCSPCLEIGVRCSAVGWGTTQQVASSIPDGIIGIFHWHNPSSCTMALGLAQPLTELSTRNISWR